MRKILWILAVLLTVFELAACDTEPPMSHFARDGYPCQPVGYSWSPIWTDPRNGQTCF